MKPTTGRRVGATRAARPSLADVYIDKVLPHGVGAGHRVGMQNLPTGGPPPQTGQDREKSYNIRVAYDRGALLH